MTTLTDLINYNSRAANKVIGLVGDFVCPNGFKAVTLKKICHTCSKYADNDDFFNAVCLRHNAALMLREDAWTGCPVGYRLNLDRFIFDESAFKKHQSDVELKLTSEDGFEKSIHGAYVVFDRTCCHKR